MKNSVSEKPFVTKPAKEKAWLNCNLCVNRFLKDWEKLQAKEDFGGLWTIFDASSLKNSLSAIKSAKEESGVDTAEFEGKIRPLVVEYCERDIERAKEAIKNLSSGESPKGIPFGNCTSVQEVLVISLCEMEDIPGIEIMVNVGEYRKQLLDYWRSLFQESVQETMVS